MPRYLILGTTSDIFKFMYRTRGGRLDINVPPPFQWPASYTYFLPGRTSRWFIRRATGQVSIRWQGYQAEQHNAWWNASTTKGYWRASHFCIYHIATLTPSLAYTQLITSLKRDCLTNTAWISRYETYIFLFAEITTLDCLDAIFRLDNSDVAFIFRRYISFKIQRRRPAFDPN